MVNMKTKVLGLSANSIKRMKVLGRNGKKRGGNCIGEVVSASVKDGEFKDPMSKKGTIHKGIIATSKARYNSTFIPGIKDIQYNHNTLLLLDNKQYPLIKSTASSISVPIHEKVRKVLEQFSKANKRSDKFSFTGI